jgi:uncharacterized protein (DUF952 family)
MKAVYKVMAPNKWAETAQTSVFSGSELDRSDGFIHLSTASQVEETVARHFANCGKLVLVAVSVAGLGEALRFEPSRGGALFPHLYAELKIADILWSKEFDSRRPRDLRSLITE